MSRLGREEHTISVMISFYCRDHHGGGQVPCVECQALLAYAGRRLEHCRFGEKKPTCAHCPVHCYRSDMREQARAVMRYSGPRMTFRHPLLAVMHLIDSRRRVVDGPPARGPDKGQAIR